MDNCIYKIAAELVNSDEEKKRARKKKILKGLAIAGGTAATAAFGANLYNKSKQYGGFKNMMSKAPGSKDYRNLSSDIRSLRDDANYFQAEADRRRRQEFMDGGKKNRAATDRARIAYGRTDDALRGAMKERSNRDKVFLGYSTAKKVGKGVARGLEGVGRAVNYVAPLTMLGKLASSDVTSRVKSGVSRGAGTFTSSYVHGLGSELGKESAKAIVKKITSVKNKLVSKKTGKVVVADEIENLYQEKLAFVGQVASMVAPTLLRNVPKILKGIGKGAKMAAPYAKKAAGVAGKVGGKVMANPVAGTVVRSAAGTAGMMAGSAAVNKVGDIYNRRKQDPNELPMARHASDEIDSLLEEKLAASASVITPKVAKSQLKKLGFDLESLPFSLGDFVTGMKVELEHGKVNPHTNVTDDDYLKTAKVALAHLNESPDYYKELVKMERKLDKKAESLEEMENNIKKEKSKLKKSKTKRHIQTRAASLGLAMVQVPVAAALVPMMKKKPDANGSKDVVKSFIKKNKLEDVPMYSDSPNPHFMPPSNLKMIEKRMDKANKIKGKRGEFIRTILGDPSSITKGRTSKDHPSGYINVEDDVVDAVRLHELGHAKNFKSFKGTNMKAYVASKALAGSSALLGAGLGNAAARTEAKGKSLKGIRKFIDKHPYASAALLSTPVLFEEGLASGRAAKHLIKEKGLKQGLKDSAVLAPALGTYGLSAAISTILGGLSYKQSKDKKAQKIKIKNMVKEYKSKKKEEAGKAQ